MADGLSTAPSLLPGQSPPLFTITPTDQAGTIVVVTGVCLVIAVVSVLIRAYIIVQIGGSRVNWDDGAIIAALFFAIIQTSLVQQEAHTGLGRTIENVSVHEARKIQQIQFADQIFYIISVWLSKISVALFFLRLSPRRSDQHMSQGAMVLIGLTCVIAIAVVSSVCSASQPWQYFTTDGVICTTPYGRWIATSVMDVLTEIFLAAIAIRIIWSLQMRSSRKVIVGIAFVQRLAIIAPIFAHLHFLSLTYHTNDPTLNDTYSTICKEVEVTFAIVAASVPCLKPFLTAMATHYGTPAEGPKSSRNHYNTNNSLPSPSRSNEGPGSIISLNRLNLGKKKESSTQLRSSENNGFHNDDSGPQDRHHSTATHRSNTSTDAISIENDDCRGLIIQKNVDYNVQYYDKVTGHTV